MVPFRLSSDAILVASPASRKVASSLAQLKVRLSSCCPVLQASFFPRLRFNDFATGHVITSFLEIRLMLNRLWLLQLDASSNIHGS